MDQPNFQLIAQALQGIAEQLRLLANHPVFSDAAHIQGLLAQVNERLNGVDQQLTAMKQELNQKIAQSEARVMAKMEYYDRLAHARTLNSSAPLGGSSSPLYPVPLPDGSNIPVEEFPTTFRDLWSLDGKFKLTTLCVDLC
ncbi:hypothetical protein FRC08_012239 [Ceratobasidium sp. 394]|nr:hypothetical protein FRC08_012239 [Ceratobasidium sp. 394]